MNSGSIHEYDLSARFGCDSDMRCRVVCGFDETMEIFWPIRAFRRVDFPEFGRPMITAVPDFMNPDLVSGFRSQASGSGFGETGQI